MTADDRREPVREFQLEGFGLVFVAGLVVLGLAGAFFVGRWYERRLHPGSVPGSPAAASMDPTAPLHLPEGVVDVGERADFFDTVEGGQKEAEPSREVRQDPPARREAAGDPGTQPGPAREPDVPAPVRNDGPRTVPDGEFFVQVFAGRDETAAARLLRKLEDEGQPARLNTDRQGSTTLYKVRVGGYPTQEIARTAADRLQEAGYAGAWVTRVVLP